VQAPSFRTLWSVMLREAEKEIGGLGSSHTAPCGAAVPARPPTRSSEPTHLHCALQWVRRATRRGTSVVVQKTLFSKRRQRLNPVKPFHCYNMRIALPADSSLETPNSTTSPLPHLHLLPDPSLTTSLRQDEEYLQPIVGLAHPICKSSP